MSNVTLTPYNEILQIVSDMETGIMERYHIDKLDEDITSRLRNAIIALTLRAATEVIDAATGETYAVKRTATMGQEPPTEVYEPVPLDCIFVSGVNVPALKAIFAKVRTYIINNIGHFKYSYWFIFHKLLQEIGLLEDGKYSQQTIFKDWVTQVYGWTWATQDFKHVQQGFKHTKTDLWDEHTAKDLHTSRNYVEIKNQLRSLLLTGEGGGTAYAPAIVKQGQYLDYKMRRKV